MALVVSGSVRRHLRCLLGLFNCGPICCLCHSVMRLSIGSRSFGPHLLQLQRFCLGCLVVYFFKEHWQHL